MRIGAKLNLIITFTVVAFLLVFAIFVALGLGFGMLKDMELKTMTVSKDLEEFTNETKSVLIADRPLELSYKHWRVSLESFEASLEELTSHPARGFLPEGLNARVDKIERLWNVGRSDVEAADGAVNTVLDTAQVPGYMKKGLMLMQHHYQHEAPDNSAILDPVNAAVSTVDVVDSSSRTMVSDTLTQLSDGIAGFAARVQRTGFLVAGAVALAILVASLVFALVLSRRLAKRIRGLEEQMGAVADKDLTVSVQSRASDEIGSLADHLNAVVGSLSGFMGTVKETIANVDRLKDSMSSSSEEATAALHEMTQNIESMQTRFEEVDRNIATTTDAVGEIKGGVEDLTQHIESQSSAAQQASSSIEEMNASLSQVSSMASDRKERADALLRVTERGSQSVDTTHQLVRSIAQEVDDVLKVIDLINDISDQTNLLSLNATIESAHAGEAGKGFAVVAEEIRKLAASTSQNADQIDNALKSITNKVRDAQQASEASASDIAEITSEVRGFATTLTEVSNTVGEVSENSQEVVRSAQSLAQTTEEIRDSARSMRGRSGDIEEAMQRLKSISGEVVEGMQEISAGTRQLLDSFTGVNEVIEESRGRIEELSGLMGDFTIEANGDAKTRSG
jgi:methyl-accepting chemotaxis protein